MEAKKNYAVLGIHDTGDGLVARVRMYVGNEAIDEDLILPRVITIEEQLEAAADARVQELLKGVSSADSELTKDDGDVVVNTGKFTLPEDVIAAEEIAA